MQRYAISELESVRAQYRAQGQRIRVRYRGPRAQSVGRVMPSGYVRSSYNAKSDCLKADATHFVVYSI